MVHSFPFIQLSYHGHFNSHSRLTLCVLCCRPLFDTFTCILITTLFGELFNFHFFSQQLDLPLAKIITPVFQIFSHSKCIDNESPEVGKLSEVT